MLNYLIFFIIALILIFIIYIGAKGLSRGMEAKSKLKEEKTKSEKNSNIVDEIEKLSDLRKKKIITEKEFEIAKKNYLNSLGRFYFFFYILRNFFIFFF